MKMPKQLSKKIISVGMCTMLLTAVGLAASTNIANAWVINQYAPAKLSNELWREEIRLEVSPNYSPLTKDYVRLYMIVTEDDKVQLKFNDRIVCPFDYKFNDAYIFGDNHYDWRTRACTERNQWTLMKGGNILTKIEDLVDKFNAEGIEVGDEVYMNGNKWPGTVRFSTDNIMSYSGNDYSKGYKNGRINRWDYGFKITRFGLQECRVNHLK